MLKSRKKHSHIHEVAPDEIFLDSQNLPNFNTQQFEGRLEKPIPKRVVFWVGAFFSIVTVMFLFRLGILQIAEGQAYLQKSQNNTLTQVPVFADRGMILDRNGIKLAWNVWSADNPDRLQVPVRAYIAESGFAHILGYVSYPQKDSSGNYWQSSFLGKDGVEKQYNSSLNGTNGVRITQTDVKGNVQAENVVTPPVNGNNITLSIDSRIQNQLYSSIADMAKTDSFQGGGGVIMNIHTGEVLALTSYPEYDPNILSTGKDTKTIKGYLSNTQKVFLNRVISGNYAPGSIVKPFLGYGALVDNIITPFKQIWANGSISVPNPYDPTKKTIFNDHGSFGFVDMEKAIALSSDVYFYEIGGGYQSQPGLGITGIDNYANLFHIGQKTGIDLSGEISGVVPSPTWKAKTFPTDSTWRLGDTYNTAIGQYGFQVTPIQMVRAVAGLATGNLVTPHVILNDPTLSAQSIPLNLNSADVSVVEVGMRQVVLMGTGQALNVSSVQVAAKSGTAQVGLGNTNTNSWIVGFFPYNNPQYAFAVLMERGPKADSGNATRVMANTINYMAINTPDYLK